MKTIKDIYHTKIISENFPASNFERMHTKKLAEIMDTSLNPDKFYDRAKKLAIILASCGLTDIPEKDRYDFVGKRIEYLEKREKFYKEKWEREWSDKGRRTENKSSSVNDSLTGIYMDSMLNSMKTETNLLKNHYYSSNNCVSIVLNYITDAKEIEKIPEIVKHDSSRTYRDFMRRSERALSAEVSMLQNFVDRYASKNSKASFKCETINLNEATIKQLIDYYKMDSISGNYLLSFHKRNKNNLAEMVNNAYSELMRTKGIQN